MPIYCNTTVRESSHVSILLVYTCTYMYRVHVHTLSACTCILCTLLGFEALQKAFQKAKSVVEKEGATPTFYIRTLMELEDFVQNVGL